MGPRCRGGRLFMLCGRTVYRRTAVDDAGASVTTQMAFYGGLSTYQANAAAFNAGVSICTPITADGAGDIYFGYQTSASVRRGDCRAGRVADFGGRGGDVFSGENAADGERGAGGDDTGGIELGVLVAVSADGSTVYVAMNTGNFGAGRLVALNAATLAPKGSGAGGSEDGGSALVPNVEMSHWPRRR